MVVPGRKSQWTPEISEDGVARRLAEGEGVVFPHLRPAFDVRDKTKRGGRGRRVGDPTASAGGCQGVQEVLADEITDETGGAEEAESRQANEGAQGFDTERPN